MRRSAGLLLFRRDADAIRYLLVHPGGPFWKNKDAGAWSIPKGEVEGDEDQRAAALREFEEETGQRISGDFIELPPLRMPSEKWLSIWAIEHDFDTRSLHSNTFEMEWPPRSGRIITVPEVDQAAWVTADEAQLKLHAGQMGFIDALQALLRASAKSN